MYSDSKRQNVRLLLAAKVPQSRIVALTGVSVSTIRRIARESDGLDPSRPDDRQPKRKVVGRPSVVAPYRETIADMLAAEPQLKTLEVLRRLRERGYAGGKWAVYDLTRRLRPRTVRPVCRFEGLAGEFSQHDFGEVQVRWLGGGQQKVVFFASHMKYSRYALVTPVPDQRVESLVRTLAWHFEQFGGLPLMAVFDRPRTIVIRSDPRRREVPEWNPTFAEVMQRLGVTAEACWPYRANQKGSVENLVGWVKGSFFKTRRFLDGDDMQSQLLAWHEEVNERRPSRATGRVPGEVLREEEHPLMRPIKLRARDLDLRHPVQVGPNGMVTFETNRYSMPAEALGCAATLHLFSDRVVIATGQWRAEHPRLRGRNLISSQSAHRDGLLAVVKGERARIYLKRQDLLDLGGDAERVVTRFVYGRPDRWHDDVERLHELLQACGSAALRQAFRRVARRREASVAAVVREVNAHAPLFAGLEEAGA